MLQYYKVIYWARSFGLGAPCIEDRELSLQSTVSPSSPVRFQTARSGRRSTWRCRLQASGFESNTRPIPRGYAQAPTKEVQTHREASLGGLSDDKRDKQGTELLHLRTAQARKYHSKLEHARSLNVPWPIQHRAPMLLTVVPYA